MRLGAMQTAQVVVVLMSKELLAGLRCADVEQNDTLLQIELGLTMHASQSAVVAPVLLDSSSTLNVNALPNRPCAHKWSRSAVRPLLTAMVSLPLRRGLDMTSGKPSHDALQKLASELSEDFRTVPSDSRFFWDGLTSALADQGGGTDGGKVDLIAPPGHSTSTAAGSQPSRHQTDWNVPEADADPSLDESSEATKLENLARSDSLLRGTSMSMFSRGGNGCDSMKSADSEEGQYDVGFPDDGSDIGTGFDSNCSDGYDDIPGEEPPATTKSVSVTVPTAAPPLRAASHRPQNQGRRPSAMGLRLVTIKEQEVSVLLPNKAVAVPLLAVLTGSSQKELEVSGVLELYEKTGGLLKKYNPKKTMPKKTLKLAQCMTMNLGNKGKQLCINIMMNDGAYQLIPSKNEMDWWNVLHNHWMDPHSKVEPMAVGPIIGAKAAAAAAAAAAATIASREPDQTITPD